MSILALLQAAIGTKMNDTPSQVTNWLDGTLLKAENGSISIQYTVRKEMTNPMGMLHGGMVSMIHDDIIGMCVLTLNKEVPYTSINLTVDFLKSAFEGDTIITNAEVVRSGNKIIYLHSSMYKIAEGKNILISKATSNMLRFE